MFKNIKIQVSIALTSIFTLIGIGTITFKLLEDWTWVQSFYFSVTTLTTVGLGDLHPTSDGSRLFTSLYILIGVSVVLGSMGVIGSNYLIKREERMIMKRKNRN